MSFCLQIAHAVTAFDRIAALHQNRAIVEFCGHQVDTDAMFFLGVANEEKGITAFNHFPDYDIDESAIEIGAVAMANVLVSYLQSH